MIGRKRSLKLRLIAGIGAGMLALALCATAGAQQPPVGDGNGSVQQPSAESNGNGSASEAQSVMRFDLNACQNVGPGLYQCPSSDKPICDPGYNRGDVDCIRVDKNGVLIRQGM